jgi:hypothetical protein
MGRPTNAWHTVTMAVKSLPNLYDEEACVQASAAFNTSTSNQLGDLVAVYSSATDFGSKIGRSCSKEPGVFRPRRSTGGGYVLPPFSAASRARFQELFMGIAEGALPR